MDSVFYEVKRRDLRDINLEEIRVIKDRRLFVYMTEAHLEPCQTSTMVRFVETVNS